LRAVSPHGWGSHPGEQRGRFSLSLAQGTRRRTRHNRATRKLAERPRAFRYAEHRPARRVSRHPSATTSFACPRLPRRCNCSHCSWGW
jgi:hypothetical protein